MEAVTPQPTIIGRLQNVQISARHDLHVSRQLFHGKAGYIVHDPVRFVSHHLDSQDYQVLSSLSGNRTLKQTFRQLVKRQVLNKDQEAQFYEFIVYLNQLGLLMLPISDGRSLYDRHEELREARAKRRFSLMNLLFVRIPLFHPDPFLTRTVRLAAPLFSKTALLIWCLALMTCGFLLWERWDEFVSPLTGLVTQANLPMVWALLLALKVVHEFGHAYACKHFRGYVPEMGAFLMLFTPCAYMDASSAWSFPRRLPRIVVSLAGMYFESIIAMAAFAYWCVSEPSSLRDFAHYTFVLSSVITVGFNLNPLMRYDGYYVLADMVNMPNLRTKSNQVFMSGVKRVLFGNRAQDPSLSTHAKFWLFLFGAASTAYRVTVIGGIVVLLTMRFPTMGLLAAVVLLATMFVRTARKLHAFLVHSPEMQTKRLRGYATMASIIVLAVLVLGVLPLPRRATAVGVVEQSDDVLLHAQTSGFLEPGQSQDGREVAGETLICTVRNDDLDSQIQQQTAEVDRLRCKMLAAIEIDKNAAELIDQQRMQATKVLADLRRRAVRAELRAPASGRLIEMLPLDEMGRFVHEGDPIALIAAGRWHLRLAMTEDDFTHSRVEEGTVVDVRLAGTGLTTLQGNVVSISETGSDVVSDVRLTQLAGGPIPVHPDTLQAQTTFFEIKIELEGQHLSNVRHGMSGIAWVPRNSERIAFNVYRVFLRFVHRARLSQ